MRNEDLKFVTNLSSKSKIRGMITLLEYYLLKKDSINPNYGLKIIKKEKTRQGEVRCMEEYVSEYISEYEEDVNGIIKILANNTVTPVTAESVLEDLGVI